MPGHWDREESVGGWGYRTRLTEKQRTEIDTCQHCDLPDCVDIKDPRCPLYKRSVGEDNKTSECKLTGEALVSAWWAATAHVR